MNQNRTEWVIHVWGKKRDTLELNEVEKFHIDMLKMFQDQQKKFDRILVNIAMDDMDDTRLFNFLRNEIDKVIVNKNVEYWFCQNDKKLGEYVTFRPYVFDRIGENVDVFYTHFKGYNTYFISKRESFPMRVASLSEMFWSYMMYRYSLDMDSVEKNLKDNSVYFWTILKCKGDEKNIGYYKTYQDKLQKTAPELVGYISDDLLKHSPGSFGWYNLKNIERSLDDKPAVRNITSEQLLSSDDGRSNLCTHFSESYLLQFLNEKECYSVKDYSREIKNLEVPLYVTVYSSKRFGKEFIKDFEKYLIENGLI